MSNSLFNPTPSVTLSDEQLEFIVEQVNHAMLIKPRCWGSVKRIVVGENVDMANTLFNTSSGMIVIGDNVFFGHNACVITGTHDYRAKGRARMLSIPDSGRDIYIGAGTWVASGVTILGPCTIGENAVIAANSVVTGGDLPGGYIYAGAPAKAIKKIDFYDDAPATPEVG